MYPMFFAKGVVVGRMEGGGTENTRRVVNLDIYLQLFSVSRGTVFPKFLDKAKEYVSLFFSI